MKNILRILMSALLILAVSCSNQDEVVSPDSEGTLSLKVLTDTRAQDSGSDLSYLIRIYNSEGLIRKYTSLEEFPSTLALLAGDYTIKVQVGEQVAASFKEKFYLGEQTFTIVGGQKSDVEVVCRLQNAVVAVNYDQSVVDAFEAGFGTKVSLGEASLNYTTSAQGYFSPTEELKLASWSFSGNHPSKGALSQSGELTLESGKRYTLNFTFSKDAPGFIDFTISVEEPSPENGGDTIIFSAEPTFKSQTTDLSLMQPMVEGSSVDFNIVSPNAISALTVEIGGVTYDLVASSVEGITITKSDEKNWSVNVAKSAISTLGAGDHTLNFIAIDSEGGEGDLPLVVAQEGIVPATKYDLWLNTTEAEYWDFGSNVNVTIEAKCDGGEWRSYPAHSAGNGCYLLKVEPEWVEGLSVGGEKVYTITKNTGIFANHTYEFRVMKDGSEIGRAGSFTTTTTQTIPNADMEDSSLTCFSGSSANAPFWGSGNQNFATLCVQSTFSGMGGSYCAKLQTSNPMSMLASGNLFVGTFDMVGMSGTVNFGVKYDWQARPRALRFKYHATVGKVDIAKFPDSSGKTPLNVGDQDKARVYAIIADWSSRPAVTAGSAAPVGCFDPEAKSSLPQGKIIAVASFYIDKSTEGGSMVTVEDVEFKYYDKITKPSSAYTMTIQCTNSAYGDYMCGCSTNVMYVDDFEWVY